MKTLKFSVLLAAFTLFAVQDILADQYQVSLAQARDVAAYQIAILNGYDKYDASSARLVDQINKNKDSLITPVLRIVFLAMNNEQINSYIGTKEVTKLTGKEALADASKLFERINVGLPADKQLVLR